MVKNLPVLKKTRVQFPGREDPLEKGMAAHSSILTRSIPWSEDPGGSHGKESTRNVGDLSSVPGSGRFPGEGNGYPLQYFGLENSMDRGAWWATVHGVTRSQT